jgi:hypothetical protein
VNVRVALAVVVAVAVAGCGSAGEVPAPEPPAERTFEQAEDGNFTLYVSNQSFERGNVDIKVWINGFVAVDEDFDVGNQHNWVEFKFHLADGSHAIRVESSRGDAVLQEQFESGGKRWAVVDYWCCGGPDEPKFSFLVSDRPIGFA